MNRLNVNASEMFTLRTNVHQRSSINGWIPEILTMTLVQADFRAAFPSELKTGSPDAKRILIKVVQNCHYIDIE